MGTEETGGKGFRGILIAIVVALAAGGTAPWWWQRIFEHHPSRYMGALEQDKNRQGNDYSNFGVATPAECSKACQVDDQCQAMTYVPVATGQGGICWLKNGVAPVSDVKGYVSAVKRVRN